MRNELIAVPHVQQVMFLSEIHEYQTPKSNQD